MPTSQAQMTGQVAWVDPARSSPCLGLCLGLMLDVLPLEVECLANLWTCQGSLANPMCRSERCASKPEVRTGQGNRTWIKQNRYILARVYIGIRMQCQRNMFSLDHFKFGIPFVFKDPIFWTWKVVYLALHQAEKNRGVPLTMIWDKTACRCSARGRMYYLQTWAKVPTF